MVDSTSSKLTYGSWTPYGINSLFYVKAVYKIYVQFYIHNYINNSIPIVTRSEWGGDGETTKQF